MLQLCSVSDNTARVKVSGCYGILNVDLTGSFRCNFEFSCLKLQNNKS